MILCDVSGDYECVRVLILFADAGWGSSVSVEYLNYALALLVYSVRYPAVFWNTNKCFGIVFSIQLLVNSVQSLLSFAGMSVLYKVSRNESWERPLDVKRVE